MYAGAVRDEQAEAAAAFGLALETDAEAGFGVWPEHWPAVELFATLGTQWRAGFNGPTGLDYAALPVVMDLQGIAPDDRRARFDEIRVLERAALEAMAERRKA